MTLLTPEADENISPLPRGVQWGIVIVDKILSLFYTIPQAAQETKLSRKSNK
jgi:hypothetical protein